MARPPTTRQRLALTAYVSLMRAAGSVTRRTHRHLESDGLTVSQFGVLEALHHLGPLCQRDLGQKILKSTNNMTTVIDNLERRGLVERRPDSRDRRVKTVCLTAAGGKLVARVFPRHARVLGADLGILTGSEQKELVRLCRKLGMGAEEEKR